LLSLGSSRRNDSDSDSDSVAVVVVTDFVVPIVGTVDPKIGFVIA